MITLTVRNVIFITDELFELQLERGDLTFEPGEKAQASAPFGWFRPGRSVAGERCVFIATGTGVAPFSSYLRSNPVRVPESFLYGVRCSSEVINLEELQRSENFT